jgi:hypothetical protein
MVHVPKFFGDGGEVGVGRSGGGEVAKNNSFQKKFLDLGIFPGVHAPGPP